MKKNGGNRDMKKLIYLDNAATTKVKDEVYEAMEPYFREFYGNPSSMYRFAGEAKKKVEESRETIAEFLNAKRLAWRIISSSRFLPRSIASLTKRSPVSWAEASLAWYSSSKAFALSWADCAWAYISSISFCRS